MARGLLDLFMGGNLMDGERILHGAMLPEVLREEVQNALSKERVETSEAAEFYLVSLLHKFHDTGGFFCVKDSDTTPLAIMLLKTQEEPPNERARSLRCVGDSALVSAGFFADRVRKTVLGLHYYISMGGLAYAKLSALFCRDDDFSILYSELARGFENFTRVISRVAPWNSTVSSNSELVHVYERWLETGDEKLQSLLEKEGIRAQ